MSKRKRHNSQSCSTNHGKEETVPILIDGESIDDLKRSNMECKSVEPLAENVNLVNATSTENILAADKSNMKNEIFSLRRKSNRILSLKRSIILNNVSAPSRSTPATKEFALPTRQASCSSSTAESTNQIVSNESIFSLPSHTDISLSSSAISSTSAQTVPNNQVIQIKARKIQVWTEDDTRWFFEALCEHGKDFIHIQSYIAARSEKKCIPLDLIKNYEQVRHYYYRMWHKILQMKLKISNVVEKGIQEIFCLINYGEIWKKFGSKFDARLSGNLQQLVDYGYTVFKMKGKSVRVRTPICNALKRIHNIDNKTVKPPTQPIPKEITLELLPETNADWIHVHSLAQNPRLRTRLSMQTRLSTLIAYLERRWSLTRIKSNVSRSVLNIELNSVAENAKTQDSLGDVHANVLRLRPQRSVHLSEKVHLKSTNNSISVSNYRSTTNTNTQIDLSLSAYLKNLFAEKGDGGEGARHRLIDGKGKHQKIRKSSKKLTSPTEPAVVSSNSDNKAKDEGAQKLENELQKEEDDEIGKEVHQTLNLFRMLDSMNEELELPQNQVARGYLPEKASSLTLDDYRELSNERGDGMVSEEANVNFLKLSQPPANTTLAQWLSSAGQTNTDEKCDEVPDEEEGAIQNLSHNSPTESKSKSKRRSSFDTGNNGEITLLTAKQARLGWNREEAARVTIGELYLLFCCPAKIVLEYSWAMEREMDHKHFLSAQDEIVPEAPNTIHNWETCKKVDSPGESPVTSMLHKLLVAANITLTNLKKCPLTTIQSSSLTPLPTISGHSGKTTNRKRTSAKLLSLPGATVHQSSPLLSNLIQETILDDKQLVISPHVNKQLITRTPNNTAEGIQSARSEMTQQEQFVAPKKPAPRVNQTAQSKVAKYKSVSILDDPLRVEEVLKALKANKFARQRRPFQRPFMYNLQDRVLGTKNDLGSAISSNPATESTNSAPSVIPSPKISVAESQTSKQTVLTSLLKGSILPTTVSLEPGNGLFVAKTQAITASLAQDGQHSMLPILKKVDHNEISPPVIYHPQAITTITESQRPITSTFLKLPTISAVSKTVPGGGSLTSPRSSDFPLPGGSICPKPNSADLLTNSQLSWLNEANSNSSLGSLIAACDIVANEEFLLNQKAASEGILPLNSEMDTHMNSMANDNSIDLMAKFADLAAQITADPKHV